MVEPAAPRSGFRRGNEGYGVYVPVGRDRPRHHACHGLGKPLFVAVLVKADYRACFGREHGGACATAVGKLFPAEPPERCRVAFGAGDASKGRAASRAGLPLVEVAKLRCACAAKNLTRRVADGAPRRPKGFDRNVSGVARGFAQKVCQRAFAQNLFSCIFFRSVSFLSLGQTLAGDSNKASTARRQNPIRVPAKTSQYFC